MTRNRWTGLAGILFGISFFVLGSFAGSTPDVGDDNAPSLFEKYWNDADHQSKAYIAAMLMTYMLVLLIGFAAGLRERLRAVDAGPLPSFVLGLGTAAATLFVAGGEVSLAPGVAGEGSKSWKADGDTLLVLDNLAYQLLTPALMAAAAMAVVVGLVTLRTRVLPVWTAYLGFVLGLTAVGSFFTAWVGFFGFPIWCLLVGGVLVLAKDEVPAGAS